MNSTESVAQEIIDHKLAQEKLREVSVMIDMRFGPGTWAGILAERQRRIQEAKEAAKKAAIEKRRRQHEWEEFENCTDGVRHLCNIDGCSCDCFCNCEVRDDNEQEQIRQHMIAEEAKANPL